ncbi:hypothetical protein GDO78_011011 [Eleutherodactylus coqui]|uniref:Nitric oxide synthase-interacting protein n=1 Tax=Eleutherodactylus coqui TaxID=57060 RepID=A0A8J6K828_ELECQ|nr:hypothetical protein GDO78_011011 [Eleutherodactylus coqui]KAG9482091.1 hypothetical protein GDO78_011011 [Eleutherodactylus coqui]KAG9482092.1 hypothetical protein GDO78_011011 [Eleutherodactylus coqui]
MTRHGKNCTAGAVYTYYEKKKDTAASGYGTQTVRLSKDAVKDFDCCCLSLQPCKDPVAYEKQKNEKKTELEELNKAAKESKMKVFLEKEMSIISKPLNPFTRKAGNAHTSRLPCAVVTLECVERLIKKDMTDPISGDKLTEKDIIVLQRGGTGFSGSGVQLEAKEARPVMQA